MITVIVPVYNERENIPPLLQEITAAAKTTPIAEIIYVDDCSDDGSGEILARMQKEIPMLRVLRHACRSGQSAGFLTGVRAATQPLVTFLDGDGQNDPKDIAQLYTLYSNENHKMPRLAVAGQRAKRQDNLIRRLSSRTANKIRSSLLRDNIRDTGCSLKLIAREDYLRLPYFNHMHRYLPALLLRDGVEIRTVDVSHRPRRAGVSKYGFWDRLLVGITDLLGVRWLIERGLPKAYSITEIKDEI